MLEILTSLGGRAEYDKMSTVIMDSDDAAIIETLAAHHCLVADGAAEEENHEKRTF